MGKKLCISVDGGGALGIGPLAFMCRLEQDLGKSLATVGQAFAGTSTGAIIAGGLSEGKSGHDLFELYRKNLTTIFTKYAWYKRVQPTCPTYDNSNLKKLLKANFTGKVSEWKKPTFITTTYMNGPSVEKVWDTGDSVDKWFAILTSTAAPTYFDVIVENGKSYCDGGMWANDPCMVLEAGLKNKKPTWDCKYLCFHTGMRTPNTESGNQTLLGWGEYIMSDWIARAGDSNYYELCANVGSANVFRASPSNSKTIKMDDVSKSTTEKVIKIWEDYYDTVRNDVLKFVKEN